MKWSGFLITNTIRFRVLNNQRKKSISSIVINPDTVELSPIPMESIQQTKGNMYRVLTTYAYFSLCNGL